MMKFSNAALSSANAVLRNNTAISEEYRSARKNAVRIPQHAPVEYADRKCLYTVTTRAGGPAYGGDRTVAICDSFDKAHEFLTENSEYFWERSYDLAVIEETFANEAYGGDDRKQYWYVWGADESGGNRYQPIETPVEYSGATGYGIG